MNQSISYSSLIPHPSSLIPLPSILANAGAEYMDKNGSTPFSSPKNFMGGEATAKPSW
jgi:hypothetical protein